MPHIFAGFDVDVQNAELWQLNHCNASLMSLSVNQAIFCDRTYFPITYYSTRMAHVILPYVDLISWA